MEFRLEPVARRATASRAGWRRCDGLDLLEQLSSLPDPVIEIDDARGAGAIEGSPKQLLPILDRVQQSEGDTASTVSRGSRMCRARDDRGEPPFACAYNVISGTCDPIDRRRALSLRRGDENMRVFISWSGDRSKQIAALLHRWLPAVYQSIMPYMSAREIGKGERWASNLAGELEACNFGLLCLTPENINAPWLHFEAGALSKLETARVVPVLFQVKPMDIQGGPLSQFQAATLDDEQDMLLLFKSINRASGAQGQTTGR